MWARYGGWKHGGMTWMMEVEVEQRYIQERGDKIKAQALPPSPFPLPPSPFLALEPSFAPLCHAGTARKTSLGKSADRTALLPMIDES